MGEEIIILLLYFCFGILTYIFLPAIMTIVEYPFIKYRTPHKESLQSFNEKFNQKSDIVNFILFHPIVIVMVIYRFLYLIYMEMKK